MRPRLEVKRSLACATSSSMYAGGSSMAPLAARGSSRLLEVVRIASITFSEPESTRPDSRKPALSATCSSRFAASRWRHCTWRIAGSCLKRTSSGGGAAGCVGGGVSASVSSLTVTVACCTNSHRPPRLCSSPNVAKSETRPEQDEVVT